MLNEIIPSVLNNNYTYNQNIGNDDFLLFYDNDRVVLRKSGDDYKISKRADFVENIETLVYLFTINSKPYFGIIDVDLCHPEMELHDIFSLRNFKDKELARICALGHQIITWHRQ